MWNLLQLFGGIQRYLEQFPDGGFFKGKNFVFDHRYDVLISMPLIILQVLLSYYHVKTGLWDRHLELVLYFWHAYLLHSICEDLPLVSRFF